MNSMMHTLTKKVDQNCAHIEELKASICDIKNIVQSMGQFTEIPDTPLHERNKGNSDQLLEKQSERNADVHDRTEDVPAAQNEKNENTQDPFAANRFEDSINEMLKASKIIEETLADINEEMKNTSDSNDDG
ncbi:hypothetical protein JCGZ_20253 [Jatropha curcas]|uniref:Uncharacterized protein n=1 Tax=Jatropha curcas TaxID=180498 RepID=A0A067JXA3_JATCU|nr:hypothetical protein JCGZ_20253 [Jatropha curcas]